MKFSFRRGTGLRSQIFVKGVGLGDPFPVVAAPAWIPFDFQAYFR